MTINLAAAVESLVADPSYRPTIRVPWPVSLLGSAGAVVVMFLISPWACGAAVTLELILYVHLRRKAMATRWGDVRAGLWTAAARFVLLRLRQCSESARNWRPQILLFAANPRSRMGLVRVANWFNQNRGLVTVCQVQEGELGAPGFDRDATVREMNEALEAEGLVAFCEASLVPDFEDGLLGIAQANGFAGLHSNTLMFGWPGDEAGVERLVRVSRAVAPIHKSVLLARLPHAEGPARRRRIDVWWRGRQQNGDLMLLLAHLLSLNPEWEGARVTLRTIVTREEELTPMMERLERLASHARIRAATDVLLKAEDLSVAEAMHRASAEADVVLLGLALPRPDQDAAYAARLVALAAGFGAAIFVRNNAPFAGQLIEPGGENAADT